MKIKIVAIFLLALTLYCVNEVASISVSCKILPYRPPTNDYKCFMDENDKFDEEDYTKVTVQHDGDKSDNDIKTIDRNMLKYLRLTQFPSIICEKFNNLESIKLQNVLMENIAENALENCKNLRELNLGWNHIKSLPRDLFASTPKLSTIEIKDNQIEELPEGIFDSLEKLLTVDLVSNNLKALSSKLFEKTTQLYELSLSYNPLEPLPDEFFDSLVNIETLNLNNVNMKAVNPRWFKNLHSLRFLYMNNNQIEDLPEGVFASLVNLVYIGLNGNKLTTLRSNVFGDSPNFQGFWIERNQLNSFDEKIIDNYQIEDIIVGYNPCTADEKVSIEYADNNKPHIRAALKKCIENYQN